MSRTNPAVRLLRGLPAAVAGPDRPPVRAAAARPGRWRRLAAPAGVLVLMGLSAITWQYLWDTRQIDRLMALFLSGLTVAPAAIMFRRPRWAWRLLIPALFLGAYHNTVEEAFPWNPVQLLIAIAVLLLVALRVDRVVLFWMGLITLIPVWILDDANSMGGVSLFVVALLVIGSAFRRVREVEGELAEQTEVSEREQARRGLLEERTRIARELHDVVAHHMSMLAVRAETAPYRLPELSAEARTEFAALAQAARDGLTDLRRLLGVLRREDGGPELAPQPDLAQVADLVGAVRRAGVDVHYLPPDDGLDRPPAPVALAGYRIVQEALANATRHAPGAAVTVQLWPGATELAVRVHNAAPREAAAGVGPDPAAGGAGHGVIGMRERATALGGGFSAGPTPDGGFSVTATLPYGVSPGGVSPGGVSPDGVSPDGVSPDAAPPADGMPAGRVPAGGITGGEGAA
jgi:signal transduction histidine kinase